MARKEREVKLPKIEYGNPFPTKKQCTEMLIRAARIIGWVPVNYPNFEMNESADTMTEA